MAARLRGTILVDTNVILECHRTGSWPALVGSCRIETVEECVTETQTGIMHRGKGRQLDEQRLRRQFSDIHRVECRARLELALRMPDIQLDPGELALWAHARQRNDDHPSWRLCGPDRASLRCGIRLGFGDRLVSLEQLLNDIGHRPSPKLKCHYTRKWQRQFMSEMSLDGP